MSNTKDWVLLVLGSGGVAATWFKPVKDLLSERSVGKQRKTTDLVTSLNESRQSAFDEAEYSRELATYWQESRGELAAMVRELGGVPPQANPPKRKVIE